MADQTSGDLTKPERVPNNRGHSLLISADQTSVDLTKSERVPNNKEHFLLISNVTHNSEKRMSAAAFVIVTILLPLVFYIF